MFWFFKTPSWLNLGLLLIIGLAVHIGRTMMGVMIMWLKRLGRKLDHARMQTQALGKVRIYRSLGQMVKNRPLQPLQLYWFGRLRSLFYRFNTPYMKYDSIISVMLSSLATISWIVSTWQFEIKPVWRLVNVGLRFPSTSSLPQKRDERKTRSRERFHWIISRALSPDHHNSTITRSFK